MRQLLGLGFCLLVAGAAIGEDARQVAISGKVVDGDGKPVSDAEVVAYGVSAEVPVQFVRLAEMKTKADGAFSVPIDEMDERRIDIVARKPGLALGWVNWHPGVGLSEVIIKLTKPSILGGAVVDEHGKAIAGAEVHASLLMADAGQQRWLMGYPPFDWLTARTDGQGRFSLSGIPDQAAAEFLVTAPGRARLCTLDMPRAQGIEAQYKAGQTDIKLVLAPEGRIEGLAVDKATGRPVSGVRLKVSCKAIRSIFNVDAGVTGDDGRFTFAALKTDSYTISMPGSPQGKPLEWVAEPVTVEVQSGKTISDVKVELSRGGLLEVVATAADTGKPIGKALVLVASEKGGQLSRGMTDEEGIARIRLLPGTYIIQQIGPCRRRDYGLASPFRPVAIVDGKTQRAEFQLRPIPKVTGVVKDSQGEPLAGAKVALLPSAEPAVTADSEGRFQLSAPEVTADPGRTEEFYLVARLPDRDLAAVVPLEDVQQPQEIKLLPAVTLTGQVADSQGRPVANVPIFTLMKASRWTFPVSEGSVKTDAQGRYEVKSLPAGQAYELHANTFFGDERNRVNLGPGKASVDVGEARSGRVEVDQMVLEPADCSVSGVVVDGQGKPVAGAHVNTYGRRGGAEQPDRHDTSASDGTFKLSNLCRGWVNLSAWASVTPGGSATEISGYSEVEVQGDVKDVKIVVQSRESLARPAPVRTPASLIGKELPKLDGLGLEIKPETLKDRMVLVCFWDFQQRPSRHMVEQLAARAAELDKQGVAVISIRAAATDDQPIKAWLEKIGVKFPVGVLGAKPDEQLFQWGVRGWPWLILADRKHVVAAEGLDLAQLDEKLKALDAKP